MLSFGGERVPVIAVFSNIAITETRLYISSNSKPPYGPVPLCMKLLPPRIGPAWPLIAGGPP